MCGIIGIIGKGDNTIRHLLDGLKRLEYRGYDSAGIATLRPSDDGKMQIERRRAEGKLHHLEKLIADNPLEGTLGIGHTRWATHGAPTVNNAHPHGNDRVVLVHNGIIENFHELRIELGDKVRFESDTDTEVIVHLLNDYLEQKLSPKEALHKVLNRLEGAFALVVLFADEPDRIYGARHGSPLAIGYGDG